MLGRRRRRRTNIKTTLIQCFMRLLAIIDFTSDPLNKTADSLSSRRVLSCFYEYLNTYFNVFCYIVTMDTALNHNSPTYNNINNYYNVSKSAKLLHKWSVS